MDSRHYHRFYSGRLMRDGSEAPWVCSEEYCFRRDVNMARIGTAALGGLLGALAGAALGHVAHRPATGATLGALAGGGAGYLLSSKEWEGEHFRGLPVLGAYAGNRRRRASVVPAR